MLFISLEGGEGSGKTTASNLIAEKLRNQGFNVLVTREPGGNKVSEEIRTIIMDNDLCLKTEALLFCAARVEHLNKVILPALSRNTIVICDRYIMSSIVYQGIVQNLGVNEVVKLNNWATDNTYPNLSFFFDVKPEIALQRLTNEREINKFDQKHISFHEKLYDGYKSQLSYYPNIISVDATVKATEICDFCVSQIKGRIDERISNI